MKRIIYLHGFRSSAQSKKAQQLGDALRDSRDDWEYITPNLSHDPNEAMAQIEAAIYSAPGLIAETTLVGSSLGGFYALHFANRAGCRAVLLNPSLLPHETLNAHLGPQTNLYTGESFIVTQDHLDTLRENAPAGALAPENVLLLVEMGDELLDHNITRERLRGVAEIVVSGGNHNLESFPQHIPQVLAFSGLGDA
jgi:uncharacterized protein